MKRAKNIRILIHKGGTLFFFPYLQYSGYFSYPTSHVREASLILIFAVISITKNIFYPSITPFKHFSSSKWQPWLVKFEITYRYTFKFIRTPTWVLKFMQFYICPIFYLQHFLLNFLRLGYVLLFISIPEGIPDAGVSSI